jgi:hypothetical protein
MTWIVRVALERPYTFVVLAMLILIVGPLAAVQTPTDIFPNIGVPVIGVAFQYTGLPPDDMSGRIITPYERILTTTVNDIEHIESTSLPGMGIVKIFFQPNVDIRTATAQVTSISQTVSADAARHHAAAHPELQRLDRADPAAGDIEPDLVGTAGARPDAELRAARAEHGSGRRHSLFLWRQGAPGADRSRLAGAAGQRPCRRRTSRTPSRRKTRSCRRATSRSARCNIR